MPPLGTQLKSLYETDFNLWIEATIAQLRDRDTANLDWDNLVEELDSVGRSDRRSLKSNLAIAILHLLKWEFQPDGRTGSWSGSIIEHRGRIFDLLEDSPSLRSVVPEAITQTYPRIRRQAAAETSLDLSIFPVDCPYGADAVLDDDFWPGSTGSDDKSSFGFND